MGATIVPWRCHACGVQFAKWPAKSAQASHRDRVASPGHWTLREARARYVRENGFVAPPCYRTIFITWPLGTIRRWSARRRSEPGSGCRHYYAAWILDLGAAVTGLVLAPRRIVRAFLRGRRCTNLYHLGVEADWPEQTLDELRERLRLQAPHERQGAGPT